MRKNRLLYTIISLLILLTVLFGFVACAPAEEEFWISSIEVKGEYKIVFYVGEELSFGTAYLHINYTDGSYENVRLKKSMVTGFDSSAPGVYELTVKFNSKIIAKYTVTVQAAYIDSEKHVQYITQNGESVIIGLTTDFNFSRYSLPEEVGGYPLTGIGDEAFKENKTLTILTIPSNIVTIGKRAFSECLNLEDVEIDSSSEIGAEAFKGCTKLARFRFNTNDEQTKITAIEAGTFEGCENLSKIFVYDMEENQESNLSLPDSVIEIGKNAFNGCNKLTSFILPSGLVKMGDYAFKGTGLTSIKLKSGLVPAEQTGDILGAFENCSDLENVEFEEGTSCDYSKMSAAFKGCEKLEKLTLPNEIIVNTTRGERSFLYGSAIKHLIASFKTYSFMDYFGTVDIERALNVYVTENNIANRAFENLTNLKEVVFSSSTDVSLLSTGEAKIKAIVNTISGNLTLGNFAFKGCTNLSNITFPDGLLLAQSNEGVFENCSSLTSFTCNFDNGVTGIGKAFLKGTNITSFDFGNNDKILSIGEEAFYGTKLNKLDLSKLISLNTIGKSAFGNISTFGEETNSFPDSLTTLGESAFEGSHINNFSAANLTTIGAYAFKNTQIDTFAFDKITYIGNNAFENAQFANLTLQEQNGLTTGTEIFKNNTSLTSLNLSNITSSNNWQNAFVGCVGLESITGYFDNRTFLSYFGEDGITFSNGLLVHVLGGETTRKSVYNSCFKDLSNLIELKNYVQEESVSLSDEKIYIRLEQNITELKDSAFENTGISDISALSSCGVTTLGNSVFKGTAIASVTSGSINNITQTSESVFENCLSLTSVTLGDLSSKSLVFKNAFKGCNNITTFHGYFNSAQGTSGDYTFVHYFGGDFSPNGNLTVNALGTEICSQAFNGLSNLTEYLKDAPSQGRSSSSETIKVIGAAITTVGSQAFANCSSLITVRFDNITDIGDGALKESNNIENIHAKFGHYTFNKLFGFSDDYTSAKLNKQLYVVNVGDSLIAEAFKGLSTLRYAGQEDGEVIGNFMDSDKDDKGLPIKGIYFNLNGCASIYSQAFYGSGIYKLVLSNSIQNVGADILNSATNLKILVAPFRINAIVGDSIASSASNVELRYYFGAQSSGSKTKTNLEELTILNGLTELSQSFFYYNNNDPTPSNYPIKSLNINSDSNLNLIVGALRNLTALESLSAPFKLKINNEVKNIGIYEYFSGIGSSIALNKLTITSGLDVFSKNFFLDSNGNEDQIYNKIITILQTLRLPNTLTVLGQTTSEDMIFSDFSQLETVNLDNIVTIGHSVFKNCQNLTSINIPASIQVISESAFDNCQNLEEVTITYGGTVSLQSIGKNAFFNCINLTSFVQSVDNMSTIPDTVTSIGENAFKQTKITKIKLSNSLQTLGASAFANITSLEEVYFKIPSSLSIIPNSCFENCSALTTVKTIGSTVSANNTLPTGITKIEQKAFKSTKKLITFDLSTLNALAEIGSSAFYEAFLKGSGEANCQIILPQVCNTIGTSAFAGNTNIIEIEFKATSSQNFGTNIISGCTNLKKLIAPFNSLKLSEYFNINIGDLDSINSGNVNNFANKYNGYALEEITVTSSSITNFAFIACNMVKYIKFDGESSTSIGEYAFANCTNLVGNEAPSVGQSNSFAINKVNMLGKFAFYNCSNLSNFKFTGTNTLEAINEYCFYNCTKLLTISVGSSQNSLPDSVKTIGSYAFGGTKISSIGLNNIINFGDYVFKNCKNLQGLVLSENITTLGNKIIDGCTNITSLTAPFVDHKLIESVSYKSYFSPGNASTKLTNITVIKQGNKDYIKTSAFQNYTYLQTVTLDGISSINATTFANCSGLENVYYTEGVLRSISDSAFQGCKNLKYFKKIEGNTPSGDGYIDLRYVCDNLIIENKSFYLTSRTDDPTQIKKLYLPSNLVAIRMKAFQQMRGLEEIYFDGDCNSEFFIGESAFANINTLKSIKTKKNGSYTNGLPGNLKYIHASAFENAITVNRVSFILHAGITSIGDYAFKGCTMLDELQILSPSSADIGVGIIQGATGLSKLTADFSSKKLVDFIGSFDNFNSNMSIIINGSSIVADAFMGLNKHATFTINSTNLTSIGNNAFKGLTNGITFSNIEKFQNLTSIGESAFEGTQINPSATGTLTIDLQNLTSLGNRAFANSFKNGDGCIITLKLPTSLNNVATLVFENCVQINSLELVYKTSNLIFFGSQDADGFAFKGCSNLTSLTAPFDTKKLEDSSVTGSNSTVAYFSNVDMFTSITSSNSSVCDYAFKGCTALATVTLDNCSSMGTGIFEGCTALTTVTLGNCGSVQGKNIFQGCTSLSTFTGYFDLNSFTDYFSSDFFVGSGASDADKNKNDLSITVIGTEIKQSAFESVSIVSSLNIDSVTTIKASAFKSFTYKKSDKSIDVKATTIGNSAFESSNFTKILFKCDANNQFSLGTSAFKNCSSLTEVCLPHRSGLIGIPERSFEGASNLTTLSYYNDNSCTTTSLGLPSTITSIGASAMEGNTAITSLTIPSSVTSLGNYAFKGCKALATVTLDNCSSVGTGIFEGCTALTTVTLGNCGSVQGKNIFQGCTSLSTFTGYFDLNSFTDYFPSDFFVGSGASDADKNKNDLSITVIGTEIKQSAFESVSIVSSLNIDSVTTIKASAFKSFTYKKSDKSIDVKATTIGNSAFESSNFTKILFKCDANNQFSLGTSAFKDCVSLTEVCLPHRSGLIGIPERSFEGASTLTTLSYYSNNSYTATSFGLSSTITSIGDYAFKNATNLCSNSRIKNQIQQQFTTFGKESFSGVYTSGSGFSITFKTNSNIGEKAFYNCSKISSITIPSNVTVGANAFQGCSGVVTFTAPFGTYTMSHYFGGTETAQNKTFTSITNNATTITANAFLNVKASGVDLGGSVTSIGASAMEGNTAITSLTIPSSVTSLGNSAFKGCTALGTVTFNLQNGKVSFTSFSAYLFEGCSNLSKVYFGTHENQIVDSYFNGNFTLSESAFKGTAFTTITIGTNAVLYENVFSNCTSLTTAYMQCFANISGNLYYIPAGIFSGATSLQTVKTYEYNGGTSTEKTNDFTYAEIIGNSAFKKTDLTGIVYGTSGANKTRTIGGYAFAEIGNSLTPSQSLFDLDLQDVCILGEYAFYQNYKIKSVTFNAGQIAISQHAFDGCSNLSSVNYKNGTGTIENTLSGSINSVESYAFYQTSISRITINCNSINIGEYAFNNNNITYVKLNFASDENVTLGTNVFGFSGNGSTSEIHIPCTNKKPSGYFDYSKLSDTALPTLYIYNQDYENNAYLNYEVNHFNGKNKFILEKFA